ncbi:quinon protein alcohol dehydrogenase-like superfamily [Mycena epipterygia]|nr:quinon protein alcohol dehydrogenase-like superfamily [Mycena epipterygia]
MVAGPFVLGPPTEVDSVGFTQDGKNILSLSAKTVYVLNSETGAVVAGPFEHEDNCSVSWLAYCGKTMAVSSANSLRIWNSETGLITAVETDGRYLAVSPDGQQAVTAGNESYIMSIWDSETGNLVGGLVDVASRAHGIECVAFSPDGKRIASGLSDGSIRVWKVPSSDQTSDLWGHHPHFNFTDGWQIDSSSERVLWVPPAFNHRLYLPWNPVIVGFQATAKLDLTDFVYGTEWEQCIDPKIRAAW